MIFLKIAFLICLYGGWRFAKCVWREEDGNYFLTGCGFVWGILASALGIAALAAVFAGIYWVVFV